jgi:tRNA threonylcarbamoyladenosine dehydratase
VVENCVVMEWGEAERHLKGCFKEEGEAGTKTRPEDLWGKEVMEIVERRRKEVERIREWTLA